LAFWREFAVDQGGAKESFLVLIESVVSAAARASRPLRELRGIAFFDTQRDGFIDTRPEFTAAVANAIELPLFRERFGSDAGTRVCLQFVYQYFDRVQEVSFVRPVVEALWADLISELENPFWITRGVANVTHFNSNHLRIQLGDGLSIRGRNFDELRSMGFSGYVLQRIEEDWSRPGASSFVLIAEHDQLKSPATLVALDTSTPWIKAARAIGALRLVGAGDIGFGAMWVARAGPFNVGLGGVSQVGVSLPNLGMPYQWTSKIETSFPGVYDALARLEQVGYAKAAGNLDLALRSFMATYDRWPNRHDSQLLDAVTSLEAILGGETEIAFKLAFRVANIMAATDDERPALMKWVKDFYDTRSRLVHGAQLKQKHREILSKVDDVRALLRQLLTGLVLLASREPVGFNHSFFQNELDSVLLNTARREQLRQALGLS
jgi:hypothetical protein